MNQSSMVRPDLLQTAEVVAREKGVDKEDILGAMEQAIQKAGRAKYGTEKDLRVTIDRKTGEITLRRYMEVVSENPEEDPTKILKADVEKKHPELAVGEFLIEELPLSMDDLGRVAAQVAKQVVKQQLRKIESEEQFKVYKTKEGEIASGTVKRVEMGNLVVDLGKAEATLKREEMIPRESFRVGDRVRALIVEVKNEMRGLQIILSRTHPEFMVKLFTAEVPEIYDGIVTINAVARDPGSRAKIAVQSKDSNLDPVGACVGMKGVRVQAVVNELQGEKVDIIEWTDDPAALVVKALAPAAVSKVVMDEEEHKLEAIVAEDQLALGIGRRGQNVRLASILTGWQIDLLTEAQEAERRQEEFKTRSALFIKALDVDEVIAHLLITEGFSNVEEIAYVPLEELTSIEGFDEDLATELQNRAKTYLSVEAERNKARLAELKLDKELTEVEGLNPALLVKLGEAGIKTMDDLADLATDELREITEDALEEKTAAAMIMKARERWFAKEDEKK